MSLSINAVAINDYIPTVLFKYRRLMSQNDFDRVIDILEKRRFYLPKATDLNDPLEGCSVIVDGAWAGCSMMPSIGLLQEPMRVALDSFRVLSLTENPLSPQMWTHYASDYKGICIGVKPSSLSNCCEPVKYETQSIHVRLRDGDAEQMTRIAHQSLLIKQEDWSYESEWRVLVREDDAPNEFLQIQGEDAFPFLIIGQRVEEEKAEAIVEACRRQSISVFRPRQMPWRNCLCAVPYGFEAELNGLPLEQQIQHFCENNGLFRFEDLLTDE